MSSVITTDLPAPISAYFTAMNNFDSAGMAAVFPDDGLVNDIQREFLGTESIKRWAEKESAGDKVVTTKFVDVKEHYGDYIVSAEVDGEYDKTGLRDTLVLTFYFTLAGDLISRLIILSNKPGY